MANLKRWAGPALATATMATWVAPAGAHSCAEPVTVVAGADTTVTVGVTLGDFPSGEIRFDFDPSFEVADDVGRPGWDATTSGTSVTFTGDPLEAGTCATFDVPVRATTEGTYRVRAFQTLPSGQIAEHPPDGDIFMQPDGTSLVVNHSGPPNPAFEQIITVKPGETQNPTRTGLLVVSGIALLGALVFGLWRRTTRT